LCGDGLKARERLLLRSGITDINVVEIHFILLSMCFYFFVQDWFFFSHRSV